MCQFTRIKKCSYSRLIINKQNKNVFTNSKLSAQIDFHVDTADFSPSKKKQKKTVMSTVNINIFPQTLLREYALVFAHITSASNYRNYPRDNVMFSTYIYISAFRRIYNCNTKYIYILYIVNGKPHPPRKKNVFSLRYDSHILLCLRTTTSEQISRRGRKVWGVFCRVDLSSTFAARLGRELGIFLFAVERYAAFANLSCFIKR